MNKSAGEKHLLYATYMYIHYMPHIYVMSVCYTPMSWSVSYVSSLSGLSFSSSFLLLIYPVCYVTCTMHTNQPLNLFLRLITAAFGHSEPFQWFKVMGMSIHPYIKSLLTLRYYTEIARHNILFFLSEPAITQTRKTPGSLTICDLHLSSVSSLKIHVQ